MCKGERSQLRVVNKIRKIRDLLIIDSLSTRAGGTASRTTRPGGARPGQGPRPEHRGVFFLLGNDFNTCYDATLTCLCARVWKGADDG